MDRKAKLKAISSWTPGEHGKGWLDISGDVDSWNVDGPHGAPHHGDMSHPLDPRTPFFIDPDGKVWNTEGEPFEQHERDAFGLITQTSGR